MATLWVDEYTNVEDGIPVQPPVASQSISLTSSSQSSSTFNASTNYVEVVSDNDCAVVFGTSPTASFGGNGYTPQGQRRLIRVPNGQSYKLAACTTN